MPTIDIPQDTSFSLDVLGRYTCNTLDEALDSTKHPEGRPFDFIVLGGGSFGAVLAARLFGRDHLRDYRILVIEAGPYVLPEHVQNLPPGFALPGKGNPGTVWGQPWTSDSPKDWNTKFPGLAFCVGGRSIFWGGWSPYFIDSEVADPSWPESVVTDLMTKVLPPSPGTPTESYLDQAARVLGTDKANDFVSGHLHEILRKKLFQGIKNRPNTSNQDVLTGNRGTLEKEDDMEAPLAVASASERPGFFASNKFSSVQLLFRALRLAQAEVETSFPKGSKELRDAHKRLMLVDNCHITRLERNGNRITRVFVRPAEYSAENGTLVRKQGAEREIQVESGSKIFLALGTVESTRLAKLAVPEKDLIGHNLMAHLRSNLTFRVPQSAFDGNLDPGEELDPFTKQKLRELQISALFVKGIHEHKDGSKGHYHIQITASGVGEPGADSEAELFKKIPSIDELDQFKDLTDPWVVVTLRGIGEMVGDKTSSDPQNRITLGNPDGNNVPQAAVRLETNWSNPDDPRITDPDNPEGTKDNDLWEAMDLTCRELAQMIAAGGEIEYLSRPNDAKNAHWQKDSPDFKLCRDTLSSTHHEAGTLWMGDNQDTSVTDSMGRIWEVDNLYAVGPALLPTIGSPNPMLSGVALARRTAEKLVTPPPAPATESDFKYLFDGTAKTYRSWRSVGPGGFMLQDGLIIAEPSGDQSLLYYAGDQFDDFVLRLQFRLPGPIDSFGKAIGNSGVYLRFRQPHASWDDLNALNDQVSGNPAWVATLTGFEVQIDEQGKSLYLDKHRTGAIYDIPAGQQINGTAEPEEQQYTPGPVLKPQTWYEFEIKVTGDTYAVQLGEVNDGEPVEYQQVTSFANSEGKYNDRGLPHSVDPRSGYIGLQAHTGQVAYRNIRIKR